MAPGSEDGGCLNCYAARMATRNLPGLKSPTTGKPFAILRDTGPRWTGDVELIDSMLSLPMHWRKPRLVFVNSMSDLFHERLPAADILSVFQVMGKCPAHTFQILTKRQARMRELLIGRRWRNLGYSPAMGGAHYVALEPGAELREGDVDFLPNVWLGVSIENDKTARLRIPDLLATPAAVRFVSYEPALEYVDLHTWIFCKTCFEGRGECQETKLDWVIIGGESGPGARPFYLEWARLTVRACQAAGVPVFVKQLGAHPIAETAADQKWLDKMKDKKGENMAEWPPDLRVREYPHAA
jgi:protein gp37